MRHAPLAVLLALVAGTAPAAPAGAATVSSLASVVSLSALPGEANRIRVLPARDGGVDILDAVRITTGTGCVATSDRSAHCAGPILSVNIDLGDGDDDLVADELATVALVIAGGPGADTIRTGPQADIADGGTGDDRLLGMEGADRLLGGSGRDLLDGGEGEDALDGGADDDELLGDGAADPARAGADTLDGGGGHDVLQGGPRGDAMAGGDGQDTVSYAGHGSAVTVRLDGEPGDGRPGENDDVAGDVEDALGGAGDDVIVGGGGANVLRGGAGDDTLAGGAGPDTLLGDAGADVLRGDGDAAGPADEGDTLDGGTGADRLTGDAGLDLHTAGAGDDVVDSREPPGLAAPGEAVDCGDGLDVARHDEADSLASCEDALRDAAPPPVEAVLPPAAATAGPPRGAGSQPPLGVPVQLGRSVLLPVVCHASRACRVTATIVASPPRSKLRGRRGRGRLIGRTRVSVPPRHRATVTVRLTRRGRRHVRRHRRLRAVAAVTLRVPGAARARWARPLLLSSRALGS